MGFVGEHPRVRGRDVERARYYPEDTRYLLELEPTVTHFEVLQPVSEDGRMDGR